MSISDYFGRDIRLRHLRVLVAIDDHGQLTRAAHALHITQPALSKALNEIERAIGEPLFDRTPQGLVATRAGAALLRAARNMLAELKRASGELQGLKQSEAQMMILGVMPTVAMTFVAEAVAHMTLRGSTTAFRVIDGPTLQLLPQLTAGRLHAVVGAQVRSSLHEGQQRIDLVEDPMVLLVAPGHPLARHARPTWDKCAAHPWVLPPQGNNVRTVLEQRLRTLGMELPQRVIEAQSVDFIVAILEQTNAITFVPARLASELQRRGRGKLLDGGHSQRIGIALPISLYLPESRPPAPWYDEFVAAVRDALALPPFTHAWT